MKTLTLQEAAELLKIHPVTLLNKANAGEVPGAKIGKCWVFVEIDLIEHIRSRYAVQALAVDHERYMSCRSSSTTSRPIGASIARAAVDHLYNEALGLKTTSPRRNSTKPKVFL